jgi:hypothetical protein
MAFKPIEAGITPYLNSDHDLVELIRSLIDLLPITVTYEWVKGHYTGKNKEFQHYLNDDADDLVRGYSRLILRLDQGFRQLW